VMVRNAEWEAAFEAQGGQELVERVKQLQEETIRVQHEAGGVGRTCRVGAGEMPGAMRRDPACVTLREERGSRNEALPERSNLDTCVKPSTVKATAEKRSYNISIGCGNIHHCKF